MTWKPEQLVFTDSETTGLYASHADVWEIALIDWNPGTQDWEEHVWHVRPDLRYADPMSLQINHFYERMADLNWDDDFKVAVELATRTAGKHLVGACPWFDATFYEKFMVAHGLRNAWHYHMIDVEALAIGFLSGRLMEQQSSTLELPLPWKSDWLSETLGLTRPEKKDRHTALGDAREVKMVFEFIMGEYDIKDWEHAHHEHMAFPAVDELKDTPPST